MPVLLAFLLGFLIVWLIMRTRARDAEYELAQARPIAALPQRGWFRDPYGVYSLRYYDASGWTEWVLVDGQVSIDQLTPLRPQTQRELSWADQNA